MLRGIGVVSLFMSVFMLTGVTAFSQSNDVIDRLLGSETARLNDALYLVAIVSESVPPDSEPQAAIDAVDWDAYGVTPSERGTITFGELSFILMETLRIEGGLFYTLFPGPRYAAREFRYLDIPARRYYVASVLSGTEVLRLTQRTAEQFGGER